MRLLRICDLDEEDQVQCTTQPNHSPNATVEEPSAPSPVVCSAPDEEPQGDAGEEQEQASVWGSAWDDDDDASSSDELEPVANLSDETNHTLNKGPKSLSEAILDLRKEDPTAIENSLQSIPKLIEESPDTEAICEELCYCLLHTSNAFDIEGFVESRRSALVQLCCQCPELGASSLTVEFYTQNVSMEVRLLILETISSVAVQMSGNAPDQQQKPPPPPPATPLGVSNQQKTRRWTLSSHIRANAASPKPNRFGETDCTLYLWD